MTAARKTREIGVRKVLGAGVNSIIVLLSKDFVKLVLLVFLIASPVAWFALHRWLADFAYRIDISPWIFVAAGMAAILLVLLTVGFHAIKAAVANPAMSLRTE